MSQKDYEAAIYQLNQARQHIDQAHSVLSDLASNLGNCDLTQDETEKLMRQFHAHSAAIYQMGKDLPSALAIGPDEGFYRPYPKIPPWIITPPRY